MLWAAAVDSIMSRIVSSSSAAFCGMLSSGQSEASTVDDEEFVFSNGAIVLLTSSDRVLTGSRVSGEVLVSVPFGSMDEMEGECVGNKAERVGGLGMNGERSAMDVDADCSALVGVNVLGGRFSACLCVHVREPVPARCREWLLPFVAVVVGIISSCCVADKEAASCGEGEREKVSDAFDVVVAVLWRCTASVVVADEA